MDNNVEVFEPTFEDLLDAGRRRLAAQRAAAEAERAAELARKAAELATCVGHLHALVMTDLPACLAPYLRFEVTNIHQSQQTAIIEAPGCAPIQARIWGNGSPRLWVYDFPFQVPSIQKGYLESPTFSFDDSWSVVSFDDISLALACAAERAREYRAAKDEFAVSIYVVGAPVAE